LGLFASGLFASGSPASGLSASGGGLAVASGLASVSGLAGGSGCAAGRRRMDKRVTASAKARASAVKPAIWAPTTGAPSGRAAVFATGRVCAFLPGLGVLVGCGWRDGNRLAALPLVGLSEGFGAGTAGFCVGKLGRLPTGRGEVTVTGGGGAAAAFAGGVACAGGGG